MEILLVNVMTGEKLESPWFLFTERYKERVFSDICFLSNF